MKSIRLEHLTKSYDKKAAANAVDGVDLEIRPGEFFFLLGPSGCGKTTLLRLIAGMIAPTSGKIFLGDDDVTEQSVQERRTAMVFQNYALWPHMTVQENVEFGPKMQKLPKPQRQAIAWENLSRIQMADYQDRKPNQLSGGQQQRVALARALAARPDVLLLDEPLSNLDAQLRLHMRSELTALIKQMSMTAVYVTHDQKEALSMADRIAVMRDGKVMQTGSPLELYNHPRTKFIAEFLGEANLCFGHIARRNDSLVLDNGHYALAIAALPSVLGQARTCCIRPERILIQSPGQEYAKAGYNVLPAQVDKVFYLGDQCQYICCLADGTHWKVNALSRQNPMFRAGDDVRLLIDPEAPAVLEA